MRISLSKLPATPVKLTSINVNNICAKEALIKVLGQWVPMNEVSILNDENGRPYYELEGSAEALCRALNIKSIDLSISHCRDYAVAFAVGQCDDERQV